MNKKRQLFPNTSINLNEKIHTSILARKQKSEKITAEDILLINSCKASLGAEMLANILISVDSIPKKRFGSRVEFFENDNELSHVERQSILDDENKVQPAKLDELHLLNTNNIKNKVHHTQTLFNDVSENLKEKKSLMNKINWMVSEAIQLGELIGRHNELKENINPLRENDSHKKGTKKGGEMTNKKNNPTKELVADIALKMKSDQFINSAPFGDKGRAIRDFILTQRNESLSSNTISDYLRKAENLKSKGGSPGKNKPTDKDLEQWLDKHFSSALSGYFLVVK